MTKYRSIPTTVDGIRFPSIKEARRYQELKLLERAGEVCSLQLQPAYRIEVNGETICKYVADFRYWDEKKQQMVVEDVKGYRTREFVLKKKLMRAVHGIDVLET